MPLPVRERILARLSDIFKDAANLGGEPDLVWDVVLRAPITDADRTQRSVVSILEGRETNGDVSMAEDRFLDVSFEFEVRSFMGEEPSTFLNHVLADIQKTLAAHSQLGGLCLHVRVTGSDVDIEGGQDRSVGGIVFATVHYRHAYGDPCRLIGE